jgi:hypothetical protein
VNFEAAVLERDGSDVDSIPHIFRQIKVLL